MFHKWLQATPIHLIPSAFIVVIDSVSNASMPLLCGFQDVTVHVLHVSFMSRCWCPWHTGLLQMGRRFHPPTANAASAAFWQISHVHFHYVPWFSKSLICQCESSTCVQKAVYGYLLVYMTLHFIYVNILYIGYVYMCLFACLCTFISISGL